ncbi:MAG: heme o synthase [Limisphaerales bacterium]
MKEVVAEPIPVIVTPTKSWFAVFCDLIKARLTFLVLLTTAVGFYVAVRGSVDYALMIHTLLGTALLASGASALNQLLERGHDAKMARTEGRPLPSGRLQPEAVLIFGGITSAAGMVYLAIAVNLLTSLLGAVTLLSYVFVYTPLKRITSLNTAIGAIPGALPPLMGWTAVRDEISAGGWALFAILFFWQLPHFLAIAWIYRDDYAKAGYVMLPAVDPEGKRTSRQAVSHTLGLLPISLTPVIFGLVGPLYLLGALVLGLGFLICAVQFAREMNLKRARALFFASIIYLPLLLALMVLDKIRT